MHHSPIDSPFPFSDRAIPIIVVAVERDNVDSETELWSSRLPSFRLPYRSVKRVQPHFERELTFQTRWNIHLFTAVRFFVRILRTILTGNSVLLCSELWPFGMRNKFYNNVKMKMSDECLRVKEKEVWILDNL